MRPNKLLRRPRGYRFNPNIHDWIKANWASDFPLQYLELGAHHCEDTEVILTMFPRARCEVWECDPRCIEAIAAKFLAGLNVTLRAHAISDGPGERMFHQSGGEIHGQEWDYSGSLCRPTLHLERDDRVKFPSTITVHTTSLDIAYALYPPRIPLFDFVWVDIQGGEAAMIRGGQATLQKCHYVYMEAEIEALYEGQATAPELSRMMLELGYSVIGKFHNNLLFENRAIADLLE